jgi:3-deoxy-7-phosphoheptulonate synthase
MWTPDSWRDKPAAQQPTWPDPGELRRVEAELATLPPLVSPGETASLRQALAAASAGKAFLLQAGDCSESFADLSAKAVMEKLKVILQMAAVLTYGAGVPVVKVGRMAGQFAKPRSADYEQVGGMKIPSFRGHMVHDDAPLLEARIPDPSRLLMAYRHSAAVLSLLRAFTKGGFADLTQVHAWSQEFVATSREGRRYAALARQIDGALKFMAACGIDLARERALHNVDFYTSHEALILGYEEALTRLDSRTNAYWAGSAHMLWVGERTRQVDGAHVEYLSGLANPIGAKVGPGTTPEDLVKLCDRLDPNHTPGKLTLISRIGSSLVTEVLPPLLEAVRESGHPVVWACDPMHANTFTVGQRKTRSFDDIVKEIEGFFKAHEDVGTYPGGIHIELTGDNVTECLGGSEEVGKDDLRLRYTTTCDPRLNARQSLDLAFRVAELLERRRRSQPMAKEKST